MQYQVQRGDTIAKVTQLLGIEWKALRRNNPHAVGQSSRTGRWFLKEGATLRDKASFESVLQTVEKKEQKALGSGRPVAEKRPAAVELSGKPAEAAPPAWSVYTIKPGDTLWALAVKRFHVKVEDIVRDNNIADPGKIHPGQKIRVRTPAPPDEKPVVASWYGKDYHGRPMANGKPYNMYANTIAHKDLPLGTKVELQNPETGQRARAVVTDRGPFIAGRDVDLSYGLARRLSLLEKGVGKLVMRIR